MSREQDLGAQLHALHDEYRRQLPDKLARVDAAWRGGALQEMHRLVHGLTGSGTTFGFSVLSDAAHALESFLRALLAADGEVSAETRARIEALLRDLHRAAARPDKAKPDPAGPVELPGTAQREPERSLVYLVEDDEHLAKELAVQLGYYGYQVQTFASPSLLEPALAAHTPAAIVMDVGFPEGELAGPQIVPRLAPYREKPVPLIFISSRVDLPARLQAVRAGGVAYFHKPVDVAALTDTLESLTSGELSEPYRILIVDDSPALGAFYAFTLKRVGMITKVVVDPQRLLETLSEFNPELILMDMYLPGCTGSELARVIRQEEAYVSVPIVFLSTETDLDKQLAAMQLGGDDFLTKPIEPEHLIAAVAARAHRYRVLRGYMERDSLTGLLNHTKLKEQLELEVNRARRQGRPLAFAMIDIDRFKSVNDSYGHPAGDRVIKSLSKLLQQRLRRIDTIGRYGGEEFAVILTDTDGPAAVEVLDQVRSAFAQVRQQADGREFSVTFSCGVAAYPSFSTAADLNTAADKALYEAKRGGRDQVRQARPG